MKTADNGLSWLVSCAVAGCVAAGPVWAQEAAPTAPPAAAAAAAPAVAPAAKSGAQIDAGEPRAHTSAPPAESPIAAAPSGRQGVIAAGKAPQAKASGAADRLDLGTATVTGDREQPKVMYIVPWKSSDIGDLSGKPMNSLLDEALAPVDREEFKREVVYYQAVRADASHNVAKPPQQGEK